MMLALHEDQDLSTDSLEPRDNVELVLTINPTHGLTVARLELLQSSTETLQEFLHSNLEGLCIPLLLIRRQVTSHFSPI